MRLVDYPIPLIQAQDDFCRVKLNVPITERRRVRVRSDRLVVENRDYPLYGVNPGLSQLDNRGAFEFLAGMGVNVVRVQIPFRQWAGGAPVVPTSAAIELPSLDFDKLCKQQKICEEMGIYVLLHDLSLGLGPPYYSAEDAAKFAVRGAKDASELGLWHQGVRRLAMRRLEALLTKQNPYTKRPFGASPALMGIQLTNEAEWFVFDPHLQNRGWRILESAPERIIRDMQSASNVDAGTFRRLEPVERLAALAKVTAAAYSEAREIMEREMGSARPLLIADCAPYAGPIGLTAFAPCDAYGWNIYPEYGSTPEMDAPVKPHDLSHEKNLDRMQVRLGDKPTIITEIGERLASGGMSRLFADATTRAATYGYAGLIFHFMYKGTYGDKSGEPAWLSSHSPKMNFDIASDPGALCAMQACSYVFRNGHIPSSPDVLRLTDTFNTRAFQIVRQGFMLDQLPEIASQMQPSIPARLGSLSLTILLFEGLSNLREDTNQRFSGNIERGHVRAAGAEIDWGTYNDPTQDWLFMRVPMETGRNLILLLGRSKPDPATQTFDNGVAHLGGYKTYNWPDPRSGYGLRQVVRRPDGPQIHIYGTLHYVEPTGKDGGVAEVSDPIHTLLPNDGIRFLEINRLEKAKAARSR